MMRIGLSGNSALAGPTPASNGSAASKTEMRRMMFLPAGETSSPAAENTHQVGALLCIADRWIAHPTAWIHRLGVGEESVEPLLGPDVAFVARCAQRR